MNYLIVVTKYGKIKRVKTSLIKTHREQEFSGNVTGVELDMEDRVVAIAIENVEEKEEKKYEKEIVITYEEVL